jgi:hypothetical protein
MHPLNASENHFFHGELDFCPALHVPVARPSESKVDATSPTEQDLNAVMVEDQYIVRSTGFNQMVAESEAARIGPASSLDRRSAEISSRFFKPGRVFKTLWSKPADAVNEEPSLFKAITFGGETFSKFRHFVVLRTANLHDPVIPLYRPVYETWKYLIDYEFRAFGANDSGKRVLDPGSSSLANARTKPARLWLQDVGGYIKQSPEGKDAFSEQPGISSNEEDVPESSNDRPKSHSIPLWGLPAKYLHRSQSRTSSLLIVPFFLRGVGATPYHHLVYEAATSSSLAYVINAMTGVLSVVPIASMIGITEVSLQKRVQRGQSTLLPYFLLILAMALLSFALTDEALSAE